MVAYAMSMLSMSAASVCFVFLARSFRVLRIKNGRVDWCDFSAEHEAEVFMS
jgi:hypothetical protein